VSVRFLVDAQLPPLLCRWLAEQGHQALHVADIGLADAEDDDIWRRAVSENAVLLTKDEDFVAIRQSASAGPPVCWLRIGNATNPALLAWFEPVFPGLMAALARGETLIEVR
jgi:predicted nuclease of predicted toxin-antitoxin system